jgi:DNA-binding transcriptional ArsR family regulator
MNAKRARLGSEVAGSGQNCLTIVNDIVNYCGVRHNVDMTAGTVIEALADPSRRQIVALLSGGPRRAGELAAEIGMSAPAMSRHLRVLLSALVITDERIDEDARARVFRLRPASIKVAQSWLDQLLTGQFAPGPATRTAAGAPRQAADTAIRSGLDSEP